jgi:hypothetical protein
VLSRCDDPFPFEAVRDLLGIVRVMYRATPATELERRAALTEIGRELRQASSMARRYPSGCMGYWSAWTHADAACRRLGELVGEFDRVEPLVIAARDRVMRRR